MVKMKNWTQNPSGQVLVATLMFCFIFVALFVGLYKSGIMYNSKERAVRATDLTALSAGAVYANGLQLVRITNAFIFYAVAAVVAAITASGGVLSLAAIAAEDWLKGLQKVQDIMFGVTYPTGAYPFLIFAEGLSLASDNGLENTWPIPAHLSWNVPTPPSPVFLFNMTDAGPGLLQAIIPNMALKFRTIPSFLTNLNKPKGTYQNTNRKTGETFQYGTDETELAPNAKNPGQKWVKKGVFKNGIDRSNTYVTVSEEAMAKTEEEAKEQFQKEATSKLKSAMGFANLMAGINLDVTDRDTPPNHTLIVYSDSLTSVQNQNGNTNDIQSISEVSVEGTGLAAWNVNDPPYQPILVTKNPADFAKLVNIQNMVTQLANTGQIIPKANIFNMVPNGP